MKYRLPALDWMRGIVVVLMAADHASAAYNSGRLVTDSPFFYQPGMDLPALQFIYRWVSHICAPTFLFLAGAGLALSISRRVETGVASWKIDRDLFVRGLIIVAIDFLFINWFWVPGLLLLQVMFAIGCAMLLMIPLRRLEPVWLMAAAIVVLAGSEFFLPSGLEITGGKSAYIMSFLVGGGVVGKVVVMYPVLPWWAMMALGWGFGQYLIKTRGDTRRSGGRAMLVAGTVSIAVFFVVRGVNGFGNMELLRLDNSWVQWLHTSKYPPSISFVAMEIGLMALVLAALFRIQKADGGVSTKNPIIVFGQTPFFFYIMHILLFEVSARALGMHRQGGLATTGIAALIVLAVLYPVCLRYRSYKARHRESWLRFI
ncbi:MAG: heparan-alpha-glucosaminide N-acetyltransferase domain-containing protein [Candidatus Eisenbacteria bacterium]